MTAAYKRARKSVKRKSQGLPSLAFKVEDNMFGDSAATSLKKLKTEQFVSFQIETVLPPEQSFSGLKKTSQSLGLFRGSCGAGAVARTVPEVFVPAAWEPRAQMCLPCPGGKEGEGSDKGVCSVSSQPSFALGPSL